MKNRNYTFTWNNYTEENEQYLREIKGVKYMVFGREVGEERETPHLQGTVCFSNARSFSAVCKLLQGAHVEVCRDVGRSIQYCKKDGDFEERGVEPQKNGGDKIEERIKKNKRLIEQSLQESLDNGDVGVLQVPLLKKAKLVLEQEKDPYEHDGVRGEWYWGPPNTGKSWKARRENPGLFVKAQNKWFCGYAGEEVILLDDLDSNVLGHYLKIWADRYSCTGEVKGGNVNLVHKKFIVTSNYHPDSLWPEDQEMREAIKRRFKIVHFNDLK